jgi:hypothetical protein
MLVAISRMAFSGWAGTGLGTQIESVDGSIQVRSGPKQQFNTGN